MKVSSHRLLVVDKDVSAHPEVDELVNRQMEPHRDFLKRIVGRTKTDLNRGTVLESTMDNFLLQSLIDQTGADVAFSNRWRYGAPVPAGPVILNDLYNVAT